jgi:hypothetical protein
MESFASVARLHFRHAVLIALMTVGLAACGDDDASGSAVSSDAVSAADSSGGTKTVKAPPTISGTPVTSITAGAKYSFVPTANAAPGSTLQFSVQNKPAWAAFDATRGGLSGSPTSAQVGTVAGIVIAVSDGTTTASLPAFAITVAPPSATPPVTPPVSPPPIGAPGTAAPTISGKAVTAINVGSAYTFKPTATGPTGTTLKFSVQNKPVWATFSATTGALTGTPTAANAGTYANIIVSVSDGTANAALAPFTVTVTQASNGVATLDWTPPTENTDDTTLTNLAGYNIYYGTSATSLTESVKVTNPGLTAYTLTNLSPGTWYFAVTSYSSTGVESARTGTVSTTL